VRQVTPHTAAQHVQEHPCQLIVQLDEGVVLLLAHQDGNSLQEAALTKL
jgi:hypothetical protein